MVGLIASGGEAVPTQVEISYRPYGLEEYVVIEAVPDQAMTAYAPIPAPRIGHYLPAAAVIQKAAALADHRRMQPRDVFDLDLLFRKFSNVAVPGLVEPAVLDAAVERTLLLEFDRYRAKVVSFLEPAVMVAFDNAAGWENTQLRVVERLEAMR